MKTVYDSVAKSVRTEICAMVFEDRDDDETQDEARLQLFTNAGMRADLPNKKVVWKRGVARYPEINHFTGQVALYNNLKVLQLATDPRIAAVLSKSYGLPPSSLGFYHGPPALIVKPSGSGASPPFIYRFGVSRENSSEITYTGLLCVSANINSSSGGVEYLSNFEAYYDLLSAYYHFDSHLKSSEILYLEAKWFTVENANHFIEDYTTLFNYYKRDVSCTSDRAIPYEVMEFYERHKMEVPEIPKQLHWTSIESRQGSFHVFNSRQAIRTSASRDERARIYIQFPMQPKPENWEGSEEQLNLIESYETGKFGDWQKPGIRKYLRENSTEHTFRSQHDVEREQRLHLIEANKSLFGL